MKKLSIVVPLYNAGRYIEQCLQSICEQSVSPDEYEVIVINDGSTDDGRDIVEKLQQKYSNIILLDQSNQGPGAARNRGLHIAQGEYVWFVDSDDYIAQNAIEDILRVTGEHHPDTLALGYRKIYEHKPEKLFGSLKGKLSIYINDACLLEFMDKQVQASLYVQKNSFLKENNLYFKEGILHEDMEFSIRTLFYAKKLVYFDKAVYCYRRRPDSIMTDPRKNSLRLNSTCEIAISLADLIDTNKMIPKVQFMLQKKIDFLVIRALNKCLELQEYQLYRPILERLKAGKVFPFRYHRECGLLYYFNTKRRQLKLQFDAFCKMSRLSPAANTKS